MLKKFFSTVVILFLMFGTLCSCSSDSLDAELIGIWRWEADGAYTYHFHFNGVGTRGFPESQENFRWSTSDGILKISRDHIPRGEIRNERWIYAIVNDALTMTAYGFQPESEQRNYFREGMVDSDSLLVGTWQCNSRIGLIYEFNADGHGVRGFQGDNDMFSWSVYGNRLNIIRNTADITEIRGEMWIYVVNSETLTMYNLQIPGFVSISRRKS